MTSSIEMKIVCFVLLALVAQISAQACNGWPACPKGTKASKAPTAAKYYQVIRLNKRDVATCYNLKISSPSASSIKIEQSMVVMETSVKNYTYTGSANPNGNWNMTYNGKKQTWGI